MAEGASGQHEEGKVEAREGLQDLMSLGDAGISLAWLADAPLFIDREQVARFYDAVARPEGRRGKTIISLERYKGQTTKLEGAVEGEASVSKLITTLLPFLDIKASVRVGADHGREKSETRGETLELHPIETPQRQLVQLTLHYLTNLPKRIRFVTDPNRRGWCNDQFICDVPRAVVFLDFPCGTKFIPMAGEVQDGRVVTIFDKLKADNGDPPPYPERGSFESEQDYATAWRSYWGWFELNFSARGATAALEKVIADGGGRVQWVDYRVPLEGQRPLHLSLHSGGEFDTGTFAYRFVKRGFSHGLRMVGTLKSEPDLNVLAVFEK